MDILEQARIKLDAVCMERNLDRNEQITVRALTPDEAIGAKTDENFVIKKGKERVIEASFRGAHGQQLFTDAPGNREGTVAARLNLQRICPLAR